MNFTIQGAFQYQKGQMDNKPKRHPGLIPVSHEHREILSFCWKIRQGLKNGAGTEAMVDYAKWFWENHLKQHFDMEEEHVFPFLEKDNEMLEQLEYDHKTIRTTLTSKYLSRESLQQTERILYHHIRYEERKVFPFVQNTDKQNRLSHLKLVVQEAKSCDWVKPFWE